MHSILIVINAMKKINIFFSIVIFFLCNHLFGQTVTDSGLIFKKIYTNKEWKKESKDVNLFNKLIKKFEKSISSDNNDLKNSMLTELKDQMKIEYNQLNDRITKRAKTTSWPKKQKDTLAQDDLPKAYNPTIPGQLERVDKNKIIEGRSETEILLMYSRILNKENRIIRQLSMMEEVTESTPQSSMDEILKNAMEFKSIMKEEVQLMAKEKGKKKS